MKKTTALLTAGLAFAAWQVSAADVDLTKLPPAAKKEGLTFAKDIKPLFETSCLDCHGEMRPRGGLRLDSLEATMKGGENGKVVTPGKSAESSLVISVARLDSETAMPKPRRGARGGRRGGADAAAAPAQPATPAPAALPPYKNFTAEEVGLVRAWIDQGAK